MKYVLGNPREREKNSQQKMRFLKAKMLFEIELMKLSGMGI